ncbi:putative reverse transcriptase domain-containing protein [Tanacetum coccineum]
MVTVAYHRLTVVDRRSTVESGCHVVIESEQRHQGHRITGVDLEVTTITERISVLERDNTRLRGMLDVESQRVDRLQRSMSRVQRELRSMPTATRSRITQDAINELIAKRVDETLKVYDAARNPEPETRMEDDQQDDHVEENVNNDNGNENGNGNPNVNNGEEEEQVEKYIGGLPDNIQRNVIAAEPTRLQDAIHIANNLMDQKLKGYAIKNAENKRRYESNSRDNRGHQQPPFKRQNVSGQNVARAYIVGNNVERRGYVGALPYCSNCRMHHEGPCTVKCGNCNRVGHMTRDCRAAVFAPTTLRAPTRNQMSMTCYERERQGHYKSECPKLKGQNRGNKTRDKNGNKGAKAKAYAIGGGGADPDSNIVTSTFLLNNHYASMLFDSGADRSFVSTTFSTLFDVIPSTLDTSYAIELADGRIS